MITAKELAKVSVFSGLDESECQRFAQKAADIRLEAGEWLIREDEEPRFFVVLEGLLQAVKDIVGQRRNLNQVKAGEFTGEIPTLLGTANIVSLQALSRCRLAGFDRQQLQELIRNPSSGVAIFQTMIDRLSTVEQYVRDTPSSRVLLVGSQYSTDCRGIRSFLSANRVQYDWVDRELEPERASSCVPSGHDGLTVVVDGAQCLLTPTVRAVAEALGLQTTPKDDQYDVVIAGAGPAGMAAGVYGASEGLRVLIVERSAAGGQAGTSSRIENYLGFPSGISGDELTERALKQARHFGSEIVVTRSVEAIVSTDTGYYVRLDGGESVLARAVLLSTGVDWHRIEVPGLDRLLGRGILYGASRHEAYSVAGKRVFVVGGGNSAGQAAVFFSNYAAEVIMLVRGAGLALSMSQYLIAQIAEKNNIRIEALTEVSGVHGEEHLERIVTATPDSDGGQTSTTRDADALFLMIGATATTSWLPRALECDAKGYICTGRDLTTWPLNREPFPLETSLPGIFCAGDVRHGSIKRVASGVGEGSMSIAFIHEYLALTGSPDITQERQGRED
jgi:thioredoxin reductase (NADPH)